MKAFKLKMPISSCNLKDEKTDSPPHREIVIYLIKSDFICFPNLCRQSEALTSLKTKKQRKCKFTSFKLFQPFQSFQSFYIIILFIAH